jgi:hypothetical protein
LKTISPILKHIKLDKKHPKAFPELLQVLKCHTQSTDYIIIFFKESLVSSCTCEACTKGLFKPLRMPRQECDNVIEFPMPIPKPTNVSELSTDLHYLSFTDAKRLPFTNEHQPALAATTSRVTSRQRQAATTRQLPFSRVAFGPIITKLKNRSSFKISVSFKVHDVVECNNCHKPRCIFSSTSVSHMSPSLPPLDDDEGVEAPHTTQDVKQ